ncbi:MAG TPA: ATP-binding protein [Alphaproteobacteria bacterium]|jgi:PAS domain S-box-containing protein
MSAAERPPKPRRITASTLFGLNVGLVVLLIAVVGGVIWFERMQVLDQAKRNARNLTDVLAAQTRENFSAIDQALLSIGERLDVDHITDDDQSAPIYRQLYDGVRVAPVGVLTYFVLGPDGRLLNSSRTPDRELNDLSDRDVFVGQRDDYRQGFYIGNVVRGRIGLANDRWIFNVSRRLVRSDGTFGGIVAAAIAVDRLTLLYNSLNVGEDGAVALFHRNGRMIARAPIDDRVLGSDLSSAPLFTQAVAQGEAGISISKSVVDNKVRVTGFRIVSGFPLVVSAGLLQDAELASWRRYAVLSATATLALAALILLLLSFMQRRIRQSILDEGRFIGAELRRKEELELYSRRLAGLTEVSVQIAAATEVPLLLQLVTDKARQLIGAHQAVTSLTVGNSAAQAIHAISMSEKYAAWNDYTDSPDGSGIYRVICETNKPMRLTQAELEAHPAWGGFGAAAAAHPPIRGWLAAPLITRDGRNFGLVQLSDRNEGEFDANDEAILMQLCRMASATIETLQVIDTLRTTQEQLLKAQELANIGSWRLELGSDEIAVSPLLQRMAGRPETGIDRVAEASALIHPDDRAHYFAAQDAAVRTGQPQQVDYRLLRADGTVRYLWSELQCEFDDQGQPRAVYGIIQDVTERHTTEEQLRQAQKMETIGHLTGGVAHDFNNLLMVIMGNLDLLLDRMQSDPATASVVNAAIAAAERGASLTRQLLAYARRQPLAPREIDVNQTIQGISRLLRRALGEQVEIETILGGGVWRALADAAQVENAVINLAINARDAMPTGGKLTVETANSALDADYADSNEEIVAGQYVMIAVTDTGTGMPPDVVARAFEPFFTTKPVGRGTGLGLSMVYGFAKQSGGHAKIYSELGHGTTVKLYLPRARNGASPAAVEEELPAAQESRNEVILVVEDDALVRSTVDRMLQELGYRVLLASTGEEALPFLEGDAHIDLLFTDVVLPGRLGGKALAEQACALRPGLSVIYSSGYTQNSIIHQGRLDSDVELLSKPYKKQDLARRLRSVLGRRKPA